MRSINLGEVVGINLKLQTRHGGFKLESEVLGINTKTGDALEIDKSLGKVVGIKVGLSEVRG